MRIGLISDYVRIPYANGSSFATQFLYREFTQRGHRVTVIGPSDAQAQDRELPRDFIALRSVPLRSHPGLRLPLPDRRALRRIATARFDLVLAQASSQVLDLGLWLREQRGVPFVCVHTLHLPSAYNVLFPDALIGKKRVERFLSEHVLPKVEEHAAAVYNRADGLIVLAPSFRSYWRQRGVRVPIHVIQRNIDASVFDAPAGSCPFPAAAPAGGRLLTLCRHTREKGLARLLTLFAQRIAPHNPRATLTLVGDGPDHDAFKAQAERLGVANRVFFPGEVSLRTVPQWYRHADLFLYTSLSETYGQVVSEAMWCGLPVVAFDDGMGVAGQVEDGETGYLIFPEPETEADAAFGERVLRLLDDRAHLEALSISAAERTRERAGADSYIDRYLAAFASAQQHCAATQPTLRLPAKRWLHGQGLLARWAAMQAAAAALGLMRSPAVLNRHGRMPPPWDPPLRA